MAVKVRGKTPVTHAPSTPSAGTLTDAMKDAIRRSGYLMEQRLVPLLGEYGFFATPNDGFIDPETGGAREIDILGIAGRSVRGRGGVIEGLFPVLLIECKNLQAPLVFFTQDQIPAKEVSGAPYVSGGPLQVRWRGRIRDLLDFLDIESFHHYYRTRRLASQFCAVYRKGKGQEAHWVASHTVDGPGNLYEGMVLPLIKALEAAHREHTASWEPDPKVETINLQFYWPILVLSGPLWECFVGGARPRYRRVNRVQFVRRHESEKLSGVYRIDVVTETGLRRLLDTIAKEVDELERRLQRHRRLLISAAREIAAEAVKPVRRRPGTGQRRPRK